METDKLSDSRGEPSEGQESSIPRVNLFVMFRLGIFQLGLGIMSLLTLGVINRVMIDELKVPALLAGGAIAMHQFVAPARILFGQLSDSRPLFGLHRTGYVWIGAALFTFLSFCALQAVWQLGGSLQATGLNSSQTYTWAVLLGIIFAGYGLALSSSSTPFAALLVDISDPDNRSKLISIAWSMLMVGIVIGAIISSKLLNTPEICGADLVSYDPSLGEPMADLSALQASITPLFIIVPAIVFGLTILATFGIEKKYSRFNSRSTLANREDKISLGNAIKILTASRQTGIFFSFLLFMTISLFMQDAVMEPYGGEVFGMCISETTQLNAFFGIGTLVGIASTGFLIVPRLGKQNTAKIGCIGAAACFILIILAGFTGQESMLKGALVCFGLASGVLTTGGISLMLDLTAAETAGTFIGAWGLAQAMARGLATIAGGAVLDLGRALFASPVLAYGLVFATQAAGMILSIALLQRVNIQEFRDNTKQTLMTAIESELD